MKNKTAVYIGRFQPFHMGHLQIVKTALQECNNLIILIGSANRHASVKNPFTVSQRRDMILRSLEDAGYSTANVFFDGIDDNFYKEWSWKAGVTKSVKRLVSSHRMSNDVALYGHFKDDSSYYLAEFPEWELRSLDSYKAINSTDIRKCYFENGIISGYDCLTDAVWDFMHTFKQFELYENLVEEWKYYEGEYEKFKDYPYPETLNFTCADAVVVCSGHVLLVERNEAPGKGSWALPGGFKNNDETFLACCLRELREETNLRVPSKVLSGSIKGSHVFDCPSRSIGIARITYAFYMEIAPNPDLTLPEVRPSSDAKEANWIPIGEALTMNMFDDHSDILQYFV